VAPLYDGRCKPVLRGPQALEPRPWLCQPVHHAVRLAAGNATAGGSQDTTIVMSLVLVFGLLLLLALLLLLLCWRRRRRSAACASKPAPYDGGAGLRARYSVSAAAYGPHAGRKICIVCCARKTDR
jgi:hypothetical protein